MRLELHGYDREAFESFDLGLPVVDSGGDIVIFDPRSHARSGTPSIAWLDSGADAHGLLHSDAIDCAGARADAYAGDRTGLRSAIAWLAAGAPLPRWRGLVYLGALGTVAPHGLAIGTAIPLADPLTIGRSPDNGIVLRQGAHSDQNIVARRHATITHELAGQVINDLRSTHGTYVDGERIACATALGPDQELGIASCFRILTRI